MTNFKLLKYGIGTDEELIFESAHLGDAVLTGLSLSENDKEHTYRLETWINYEPRYMNRYFENGEDVTEKFRRETLMSIMK